MSKTPGQLLVLPGTGPRDPRALIELVRERAAAGQVKSLMFIEEDTEGRLFLSASHATPVEAAWDLDVAKKILLEEYS